MDFKLLSLLSKNAVLSLFLAYLELVKDACLSASFSGGKKKNLT